MAREVCVHASVGSRDIRGVHGIHTHAHCRACCVWCVCMHAVGGSQNFCFVIPLFRDASAAAAAAAGGCKGLVEGVGVAARAAHRARVHSAERPVATREPELGGLLFVLVMVLVLVVLVRLVLVLVLVLVLHVLQVQLLRQALRMVLLVAVAAPVARHGVPKVRAAYGDALHRDGVLAALRVALTRRHFSARARAARRCC